MAKQCKVCGTSESTKWIGRLCYDCYLESQREYYHKNPEKSKKTTMAWRKKHPDKYRETQRIYHKERYKDPDKRLKMRHKNNFSRMFRQWIGMNRLDSNTVQKLKDKTILKMEVLLGCDMETLVERFERQWVKDYGCEIDWNDLFIPSCDDKLELEHIIPVRKFNFTELEDIYKCWNFGNLKMLKQIDNRTGRPVGVC